MTPPGGWPAAFSPAAASSAAREIPLAHTVFSVAVGFVVLAVVLELIRRNRLQERYAALWILAALIAMTYRLWLGPVALFSDWAEIGDPVTVVLFLGILMSALLILQLSVKVSEFSGRIKNLVQEVALLKHERERETARREEAARREETARTDGPTDGVDALRSDDP